MIQKKSNISERKIQFFELNKLFKIGQSITFPTHTLPGSRSAGTIRSVAYAKEMIANGVESEFFIIQVNVYILNREGWLRPGVWVVKLQKFNGARLLTHFPIRLLTSVEKKKFSKHGKMAYELLKHNIYHAEYTGSCWRLNPQSYKWKTAERDVNGRIMIDLSLSRYEIYDDFIDVLPVEFNFKDDTSSFHHPVAEEDYFSVVNVLPFFSLDTKSWRLGTAQNFSPVKYRTDAFDKLVLNDEIKKILSGIVKNTDTDVFKDIIDKKGGGSIILLCGHPGLGKTLTAEALAEKYKKPLIYLSPGDISPSDIYDLDRTLKNACLQAERWGALLLIDEVDIYLEKRYTFDMNRNAVVGSFLRCMEYFNGLMFLTSNRIEEIDEAFHSRILYTIKYEKFNNNTSGQLWKNLLTAANINIKKIDINKFIQYDINGRQIKNTIRMAQLLSDGKSVTEEILLKSVRLIVNYEKAIIESNKSIGFYAGNNKNK